MSLPFVTKDEVIEYLRLLAPQEPIIEVSGIYPNDDDIIPYGVYVNDIDMVAREPYQLGIQRCGSIYIATDEFNVLFVSFQNDPQARQMLEAINELAEDAEFWNGYHEVDFTMDTVFGNRSEKFTYTFTLKRLNFNN